MTNIVNVNILRKNYLDSNEIGQYAKQLRINAGLSQKDIAEIIGSSQPNISAAEKGESTRYIFVAINIIKHLGKTEIKGPYYKLIDSENE